VHLLAGPPRLVASRLMVVRCKINRKSIPSIGRPTQEIDVVYLL